MLLRPNPTGAGQRRLAVVVKGYPRLSETFVAQELLGLERRGFDLEIWSLRHPTDKVEHPMHGAIVAGRRYLPEYLRHEPWRVLKAALAALVRPRLGALLALFWRDVRRDGSINRWRRLGQALVLARELGADRGLLYVHFLHTPGSVARYAALLTGRPFAISAHARDIWTTPEWEKREKLADAAFLVTCTKSGWEHLDALAPPGRAHLLYHGLDLSRFPAPPAVRANTDGSDPAAPVNLVSVGRLVEKKGTEDLLAALAALPPALHWRLVHIGSGPLKEALRQQAAQLGIAERITWRGGQPQDEVIAAMRAADLFVLAAREAGDGDRDGLPNVLMEAATQALPLLATDFSAIPEFITDGREGLLVPPRDPPALAAALARLVTTPAERAVMGAAARRRVQDFSADAGIDRLAAMLDAAALRERA